MKALVWIGSVTAALIVTTFAPAAPALKPRFSLSLHVRGPGTVVASPGTRCAGYLTRFHSCRLVYAQGVKVKLTALPKVDARLSSLRGSISGMASTVTLTMNAPKVVIATFARVKPTPPPRPAPPPPPPPPGSSRANPAPIGTTLPISTLLAPSGWQLRVNSVVPDGTQQVLAANQFNKPPPSGQQFFLISITATYTGAGSSDAGGVIDRLKAVGASNVAYTQGLNNSCGVTPAPDFILVTIGVDVFSGGSVTGNICFSVLSSDASSLVLYNDQTPPVWFALH
jgi:hypothetical protein